MDNFNRQTAWELLTAHLKDANLQKHSLAVGYVMQALAKKFNQDEEKWFVTGILHDIDYDNTKDTPKEHGIQGAKILEENGYPQEVYNAVKLHTGYFPLTNLLEKSLYAADPVTGLITAAGFMYKKLSLIKLKSLKKKYKSKNFAAGASREQIASCADIGMELEDFLQLALTAMAEHEEELGF